jgi:hypothetical protein
MFRTYSKWCKKNKIESESRADLDDLKNILEMENYHIKPNPKKKDRLECFGISLV